MSQPNQHSEPSFPEIAYVTARLAFFVHSGKSPEYFAPNGVDALRSDVRELLDAYFQERRRIEPRVLPGELVGEIHGGIPR